MRGYGREREAVVGATSWREVMWCPLSLLLGIPTLQDTRERQDREREQQPPRQGVQRLPITIELDVSVGFELGADYLLESSVRRDAERVRITSRLIRAADQVQVWGTAFDRPAIDALAVQREMGTTIPEQGGGVL